MRHNPEVLHIAEVSYYVAARLGRANPVLAGNLLIGTALRESQSVLRTQIGIDPENMYLLPKDEKPVPAIGLWQIEPDTLRDLVYRYLPKHPCYMAEVESILGAFPLTFCGSGFAHYERLLFHVKHNDMLACTLARLRYLCESSPIPDTVDGHGDYWKQYYQRGGPESGLQASDYVETWYEYFGKHPVTESLI